MHAASLVKLFAALLAAAAPAAAELAVTLPTAQTTCTGGQTCRVTWNDNGRNNITLAQHGNCTVALYTGNAQQQTFLQPIAFPVGVNVATTAAIEFVVDPAVGANSDQYFIRFSSETLRNPTSPNNPYLSFSAKFTLSGMSGTFNSSVQAQLAGVTGASGTVSSTSAGGGGGAGGATSTSRTSSSTPRPSGSNSANNSTGAASPNVVGSSVVAAGALFAGVIALF